MLQLLRMQWKLLTILETSNKSVWSNAFWCVKVCIFWKCIQNTIDLDKTKIFKKFTSDKINGRKNALFFLWRAPTRHSFIFNLRFLYELKRKARLSKTVWGIFHFRSCFVFVKVYIFVQQNAWTLWLLFWKCNKYTFRIYILLHIKKIYFTYFCWLFLKSLKAFSVSLISDSVLLNETKLFST